MSERDRDAAEAGRVEAEAGRVEAEGDRVHAEGGAEHEESRREAEVGRVDAEILREKSRATDRRTVAEDRGTYLRRWAVMIAIGVGFIAMVPSLIGLVLLDREIHARCVDAAENRQGLRNTITDGLGVLGYRYVPETGKVVATAEGPIDYYRTHPDERDAALARTLNSLNETFPPIKCGDAWFGL